MVALSTGVWHPLLNKCCGHEPEIEEEKNTACVFCWHCGKQTDWVGYCDLPQDNICAAVAAWNNGEFKHFDD
jgi:hypothetical protein